MSGADQERESLAEGSLISHLIELRDRLLRALIAVFVVFIPCALYSDELFTLVATPLIEKMPQGTSMIATSIVAPFMAPLKLALLAALFLAMPYVLYQAWAFVAPGLYKHEKRFAVPLVVSSIVLFYTGVAFAYFVVFPLMFAFLTSAAPTGVQVMTDMSNYLDFVLLLFFAFGIAFEIPIATVLLAATGLVKIETMTSNRGYVVLGIFIVAAFLTPPDALSQSFMAVPMYILYEGGIVMARLLLKNRLARQRAEQEANG
ncbi:sec-independent protein translocase protein TatC [Povalibacter uvarum]|uniref:Sec-independent protein translocase protein TatC n=1 Tax=Povalibacter uvarum TaxID=732238 RepID=A0A841HL42_9GAMM|nr:twin-arginine translocase subunit TatC [Povalibacter uvarum]MBB6093079.1 sec-independent protein translocase protein TatC [Povalibacter uvarum]